MTTTITVPVEPGASSADRNLFGKIRIPLSNVPLVLRSSSPPSREGPHSAPTCLTAGRGLICKVHQLPQAIGYASLMSSNPRTPKSTLKVRRLPKVGDTMVIPATVTRIAGDDASAAMTVRIKASGHLTTARAEHLLNDNA